jgi:hypothetical protein
MATLYNRHDNTILLVAVNDLLYEKVNVESIQLQNGATAGAVTIADADGDTIGLATTYLAANEFKQITHNRTYSGVKLTAAPAGFVGALVLLKRKM